MNTLKMFCVILFLTIGLALQAQGITGTWVTIDDESGDEKSHVEIEERDGKYFGVIKKLLPSAKVTHCSDCKGDMKDQPLEGMVIIEDLKPYKDYYSYGTILDPSSGKEYKCSIWREGNTLKVRGYIGISALGRTQIWQKLD